MVSVVIPTFQRPALLLEAVKSVLNQTYRDLEVIIVDDDRENNSFGIKLIETLNDNRVQYIKNDRTKGGNGSRNTGILKSQGKYVIFLDDDDILALTCIENRLNIVSNKGDKVDFAVFPTQRFRSMPGDMLQLASTKSNNPIQDFIQLTDPLPWSTTSPIWNKNFLVKIGMFNEGFSRLQDPELHLRALLSERVNYLYCFNEVPDSYLRISHASKRSKKFVINAIDSVAKYINSFSPLIKLYDNTNGTSYFKDLKKEIHYPRKIILNDFFALPHIFALLKISKNNGVIGNVDMVICLSVYFLKILIYSAFYPIFKKIKYILTE